jgi:hypothetical protein
MQNLINSTKISLLLLFLLGSIYFAGCKKGSGDVVDPIDKPQDSTVVNPSVSADVFPASIATTWTDLHVYLIQNTPGFTAPVAARSMGYVSLALYESIVPGIKTNQSLVGQVENLKNIPKIEATKTYHWGLAANAAQYTLIKEIFSTTSDINQTRIDSLRKIFEVELKKGVDQGTIDRSITFGAAVANAVWDMSKVDGGHLGNLNNFPLQYTNPVGLGLWKPTSTQKTPMLPYWGKNKLFDAKNKTLEPENPTTFSFDKNSTFFEQATELIEIKSKLSTQQKAIADFWNDGTQSYTSAGHHMNIASQILKTEKANLPKAAETYVKMGLALNDTYISAWRIKYKYNLMRPLTYIKDAVDPRWTPYLITPVYPDFISDYSAAAGASAEILASIFGEVYNLTDKTQNNKFAARTFSNFTDYANECSLSRLYGGAQYGMSGESGLTYGRNIAKNILAIKFRK